MGKVRRPRGVIMRTVWPKAARSLAKVSRVRTTPLTWGDQASVTIMIFKRPATPGTGPGSKRLVLRGYKRGLGNAGARGRSLFAGSCGMSLRRICPAKNLHIPMGIFDKGAAAFNPVSVVEVKDIADPADFGMVDMAAHYPVDAAQLGLVCHDLFEAGDIFHRVLDLVLQPGRQRPVRQAEPLAHRKQQVVPAQGHAVSPVPRMGQPFGASDHAVEPVAVQHPQPIAVGS